MWSRCQEVLLLVSCDLLRWLLSGKESLLVAEESVEEEYDVEEDGNVELEIVANRIIVHDHAQ